MTACRFGVTTPIIMAVAPAPSLLTDMLSVNQSAADTVEHQVALLWPAEAPLVRLRRFRTPLSRYPGQGISPYCLEQPEHRAAAYIALVLGEQFLGYCNVDEVLVVPPSICLGETTIEGPIMQAYFSISQKVQRELSVRQTAGVQSLPFVAFTILPRKTNICGRRLHESLRLGSSGKRELTGVAA